MNDTTVRADRNINTGLFKVLISCLADFDQSGSLSTADTLLFTGDADGAAADTDLDKVSAAFCQEEEAVTVDNVASTDLDRVTIGLSGPFEGAFLPFGEAFGRVDTQNVCASLNQCGNALFVVTGIDTGTYDITFLAVEQFQSVFFMGIVVLTEYQIFQMVVSSIRGREFSL